jgi:hypothetical protein
MFSMLPMLSAELPTKIETFLTVLDPPLLSCKSTSSYPVTMFLHVYSASKTQIFPCT